MEEAKPCPDCGVPPGVPHGDGCDVARCLWTGGQRIQCSGGLVGEAVRTLLECRCAANGELAAALADYCSLDDYDHECGADVWSGRWPGDDDCERLGLWCVWGADIGRAAGWVAVTDLEDCAVRYPGVTVRQDLNRLGGLWCRWDRAAQRWELR